MQRLQTMIMLLCLVQAPVGCKKKQQSQSTTLPKNTNVLLITLDTTRADRMGFHGYKPAGTPTLNALAERGMVFDDAHTVVPLTLPAHASLLTGRFPREHGIRVNGAGRLGNEMPTLATVFQSSGYRTGAFVSAFVLDAQYGLTRGFDVYDDEVTDPGEHEGESERKADAVTNRALTWLTANRRDPFFCWIHYYDPHQPYSPPPAYRARHPNPYDGEIAFVDAELSRVTKWLSEHKLEDRTLIVVVGDHGESFGEHGELGHTTFLYESNVRIPLLFAHPGRIAAGRTKTPVSLIDVFPTLLDLFGLPQPEQLMGQSLVAVLSGKELEERNLYAESEYAFSVHHWAQQRSLINARWKYVSSTNPELYDRRADRAERTNLAAVHRDVVKEMQTELRELYFDMAPAPASALTPSAEAMKKLESLGYVSGGSNHRPDELLTLGLPDPKDLVDVIRDLQEAHRLEQENQHSEVIGLLEKARRRSPQSVDILRRLGQAYVRTKRVDDAVVLLKQAVKLEPEDSRTIFALGDAYMEARQFDDAAEHFELVLEQHPEDLATLERLASALFNAGKKDEAIVRFQNAVRMHPDKSQLKLDLGLALMENGNLAEAEIVLQQCTEVPATAAQAHYLLARLASKRNRIEPAYRHLEKAVELRPDYIPAVESLSQYYLTNGRTKDAVRIVRAARSQAPDNVALDLTLAEILSMSHDDSIRDGREAERIVTPLIGRVPGTRALTALAAAKAELGDFDSAKMHAEKALSVAHESGNQQIVPFIEAQLEGYRNGKAFRSPLF